MRTCCKRKSERGAMTIVEATFVFPIMFFIVFFMIMAGEAYFQHARVEYIVTNAAISGAARCENPMMKIINEKKSVPTDPAEADVMPYRYIFTSEADKIADDIESELKKTIKSFDALVFKRMVPDDVLVSVTAHMNPLISSLEVSCDFTVPMPLKMFFSNETFEFDYSVSMSASIGDPAEFIRNVTIVEDVLTRNQDFTEFCGKIKDAMVKIGTYIG